MTRLRHTSDGKSGNKPEGPFGPTAPFEKHGRHSFYQADSPTRHVIEYRSTFARSTSIPRPGPWGTVIIPPIISNGSANTSS